MSHPRLTLTTPAHPVARHLGRAVRHLAEGPHLWGSVDVTPAQRTTVIRTRLTVFRPGTNSAERRALHFFHYWPIMGAVVALFVVVGINDELPALTSIAIAIVVYAAGFWFGSSRTRTLRATSRHLTLVTVAGLEGSEVVGDIEFFREATDRLRAIDTLDDRGVITAAEYEARWAEIYNALPAS